METNMFCPKCAAKNEIEQKFCRQCGQSLETIALVLKGNLAEAMKDYENGYDWLASGVVTFGVFLLIAALVYFFGTAGNAAVNIGLGLVISLPMVIKGMRQIESATKLLETEKAPTELPPAKQSESLPPASLTTDSLIAPASVTEQTTRKLMQNKVKSEK